AGRRHAGRRIRATHTGVRRATGSGPAPDLATGSRSRWRRGDAAAPRAAAARVSTTALGANGAPAPRELAPVGGFDGSRTSSGPCEQDGEDRGETGRAGVSLESEHGRASVRVADRPLTLRQHLAVAEERHFLLMRPENPRGRKRQIARFRTGSTLRVFHIGTPNPEIRCADESFVNTGTGPARFAESCEGAFRREPSDESSRDEPRGAAHGIRRHPRALA